MTPDSAAVLEQHKLYRLCADLAWEMRFLADDKRVGPFAARVAGAFIDLVSALALDTKINSKDVLQYVMEADFYRWMASPEGIAHNKMLAAKR